MTTTAQKLQLLIDSKAAIKAAIIAKGQTVTDNDTFASYANKILAISSGGTAGDVILSGTLTGITSPIDITFTNTTTSDTETCTTDSNGNYVISLPEGTYNISISVVDYILTPSSIVLQAASQNILATKEYITFTDQDIESICVTNWSSDGIGVTPSDAAAVETIRTVFSGHTDAYADSGVWRLAPMQNMMNKRLEYSSSYRYGYTASGYVCTPYYRVNPGDTIVYTNSKTGSFLLFGGDFVYKDYWGSGTNKTITISSGCYAIRMGMTTSGSGNAYIYNQTTGEFLYKGANVTKEFT